jgi:hypothetical protein
MSNLLRGEEEEAYGQDRDQEVRSHPCQAATVAGFLCGIDKKEEEVVPVEDR